MKAIIMAGGFGTRLRPVSGEHPKPMVPICGRPAMEHIVNLLRREGFEDICAALKYGAGEIMDHFGDGARFGVKMQYRLEDAPMGTAGAVKNCADFYGAEDFLVISADAACDFELSRLMAEHKNSGAAVSIAVRRHKSPLRYGLALSDAEGHIRAFIEKPDWPRVVTDRVNTGIYVISPRVMEKVPEGREYDFGKELFPKLLADGEKLMAFEMQGYWRDIGTPRDYYKACVDAIEGRLKISVPEEFKAGAESPQKPLIRQPDELPPSSQGEGFKKAEILIPCEDRAGLMQRLSAELMELGADYRQGISLSGGRLELKIWPSAASSALCLAVKSPDAEFAGDMLEKARRAVEEAAR